MIAIERQVIVTWYTPEEKLPPEDITVVVSMSGRIGAAYFDHALVTAEWADDGCGWFIYGAPDDDDREIIVHAWCDLEPYGLEKF